MTTNDYDAAGVGSIASVPPRTVPRAPVLSPCRITALRRASRSALVPALSLCATPPPLRMSHAQWAVGCGSTPLPLKRVVEARLVAGDAHVDLVLAALRCLFDEICSQKADARGEAFRSIPDPTVPAAWAVGLRWGG